VRDEYVLVFDGNEAMCIDRRVARSKGCNVLNPGMKVYQPPNPSPGIMNLEERKKVLDLYFANPMVVEIQSSCDTCSDTWSRHFLCFGFKSSMPYFVPGTVIRISNRQDVRVSGMIVGYGQRKDEYAVLLSLDQAIALEEASELLPGFQMNEVDDDESACRYLSKACHEEKNKTEHCVTFGLPLSSGMAHSVFEV